MNRDSRAIPIEHVMERFKGRYIAAKVLERDDYGQPKMIEILYVGTKADVREHIYGVDDVCVFLAGPIPEEGYIGVF